MGMTLFDSPSFANHEGVHAFFDEKTGLKAIVAVHSTARGPACGGTRMWNYSSSAEALEDVLRLSKGMSYKNALAGLPLGGGKADIKMPVEYAAHQQLGSRKTSGLEGGAQNRVLHLLEGK